VSYATNSLRVIRASDEYARDLAGRVVRFLLVVLGLAIMAVGLVTAVLPGHLGLPILVVGLMIVLTNSFKARRRFVRMQRAHPKMIFPLRRLMRREPEVILVVWQQMLRVERLIPGTQYRILVKLRRALKKRAQKPPRPPQGKPAAFGVVSMAAE
jgi:hypothetical protein